MDIRLTRSSNTYARQSNAGISAPVHTVIPGRTKPSQTAWTQVRRQGNVPVGPKNESYIRPRHTQNYYAGLAEDTPSMPSEAVLDSGATHTFFLPHTKQAKKYSTKKGRAYWLVAPEMEST